MILEAKRDNQSAKLHFSVQDMFRLPYAQKSFEVVIVSNALHIVPHPEKALQEIRRVLKDDGVLIAPTSPTRGTRFPASKSLFHEYGGIPPPQQVDKRGIPAFPASKRLGGAEKRGAEGLVPVDLCGMHEIGGARCRSLKTPASPWASAENLWLP